MTITRALAAELTERSVHASGMTGWWLRRAEGRTITNTTLADEQTRFDVARRRRGWRPHQKTLDKQRQVFVDHI